MTQELAEIFATLSHAAEVPTTWTRHQLERVVGSFIVDACRSGRLVALRSPVHADARGKTGPGLRPRPPSQPAPPPPSRPAPTVTYFEARYTDEIGEPIAGAAVELEVGNKHPRVTDGAGQCRLDDAREQFGRTRVTDLAALREVLRPRWDTIREEPWLEPQADHSFHPLEEGREIGGPLLAETLHTVVVQPWCIRARLLGMYFDTNKSFLLPTAMPGIRGIKQLYDQHPSSHLLVVGHTDTTGDPWYNDPLSLERADSVAAFLTDDVDAWYAWYAPSHAFEKRWGADEDRLMLTSLTDFAARPAEESPVRWYQRTRGLQVTGLPNEATRRRLISEYMAHDETTLHSGTPMTTHGCGESFPLSDDEIAAVAQHIPEQDRVEHRRVELYFFDKALGIQPPPPGELSRPSSPEYPEWRKRARETHDFSERITHPVYFRLKDFALNAVEHAACRVVDRPELGHLTADVGGWVQVPCEVDQITCELEWTVAEEVAAEAWPYRRRVFLDFAIGAERGRRMLNNLGFGRYSELEEQVRAFQRRFERTETGRLGDVYDDVECWHEGGPPPRHGSAQNASFSEPQQQQQPTPPPQPPQPAPPGRREPGTTTPGNEVNIVIGISQAGVSLEPDELDIDFREAAGPGPPLTHLGKKKRGVSVFVQYLNVTIGTDYVLTVVRRDASGKIVAFIRAIHAVAPPPRPNAADGMSVLLQVPVVEFKEEPTHKFGFDKFETVHYRDKFGVNSSEKPPPEMDALSIDENDSGRVKVKISGLPPGHVFFRETLSSVCVPKISNASSVSFVLEIDAKGTNHQETDIEVRLGSVGGPKLTALRVLILKEVTHTAKMWNIFDTASPGATTAAAPAGGFSALEAGIAEEWKDVVAKATLSGSLTPRGIAYDHFNSKTMVVGMHAHSSAELAVFAAVARKNTVTIVLVKNLEHAFFLNADAVPPTDVITVHPKASNQIRIGESFNLRDNTGKVEAVRIRKTTPATGTIELQAAIGSDFRIANQAALFHTLRGIAVDHGSQLLLYTTERSLAEMTRNIAHELGHKPGGLSGVAEIKNLLFDGGSNEHRLRYRALKKFFAPSTRESQWKTFKR